MQVCFPGHIAGRGELRSRDYPEGPNWHLCLQASFLPTALQRATMTKCVTYTSGQVTPLLKTCQGLLISLRVNLISSPGTCIHHPPTSFHSFPCTYMLKLIEYLCDLSYTTLCCLFDVPEDEFSEPGRTFPAKPNPQLWEIS